MSRPDQRAEQRKQLLPIVCQVFSELGYHRTTTAELAKRCGVRENILYRLWDDKKAMFLAAIDDLFSARAETWAQLLTDHPQPGQAFERLLDYEVTHQGEFGFYRVVFTALTQSDDAEINAALVSMYGRFQKLIRTQVEAARDSGSPTNVLTASDAAWALIGLATVSNIARELKLLGPRQRKRMFAAVAKHIVSGSSD